MASDGDDMPEEPPYILYVGHHESPREGPVTSRRLGTAQQAGYDLLTAPITTPHFQSRVLATLAEHVEHLKGCHLPDAVALPTISPLLPEDSDLAPEETNSALIGLISPWIDLGSRDPLIAHISKQVFNIEVAYAAFSGVGNVLVHGPISGADTVQYARCMLEGLGIGPYIQLQILLPITGELELDGSEGTHLSELARSQYVPEPSEDGDEDQDPELFGSWETWNTIRTICSYSTKLTVGMSTSFTFMSISFAHLFLCCHRPCSPWYVSGN